MGHIQDRGSDIELRWQARYRGPDGREHTKSHRRKIDAERWIRQHETAMDRGEWVDPAAGQVTLAEWAPRWLATRQLRPSTRTRYEGILRNHILPALGDRPLASIRQPDAVEFVSTLTGKGLAPATVRKGVHLLGAIMEAAVDACMIVRSPVHRIPIPDSDPEAMKFCTHAEVARLADAIDPHFRVLVLVLAYGGLRIGEATALRPEHLIHPTRELDVRSTVAWVGGHPHIGPPKTKAGRRRVTLPTSAWHQLRGHLGEYATDDLVFPGPQGGLLRHNNFRRRQWKAATAAVGLDGLRPHDLRHTAVSLWIAAGADPKTVSVRAGHTSVAFTLDRYGHLYGDRDAELAGQLDAMIEASDNVVRLPRDRGSA